MAAKSWRAQPPERKSNARTDWKAIAAKLRRRPGEWVLVAEQIKRSTHGSITRGRIAVLRDPDWVYEASTRNTNGDLADLWMSARARREDEREGWDSRR